MPLAAVRATDMAFLISVSGAGVPAAETTIDQAENEMRARGMRSQAVEQIVGLMKRQYQFARTGRGWDEYAATRARVAARMGEAALKAGGNRDYTLRIVPQADHLQLEAKIGSNAEMMSLQRFVPAYFTTIQDWLATRIRGFGAPR